MFDKLNSSIIPSMYSIENYIQSNVWNQLIDFIESTYQISPKLEYSRCAVPGWNIKYRKKGKSLCTLYPMEGYFICLIVINDKQAPLFESAFDSFSSYTQELYKTTAHGNGQRWLMLEIEDNFMLEDIKLLFQIRLHH